MFRYVAVALLTSLFFIIFVVLSEEVVNTKFTC